MLPRGFSIFSKSVFFFLFLSLFLFSFNIPVGAQTKCDPNSTADTSCFGLHEAASEGGFAVFSNTEDDPTPALIIGKIIEFILSFVGVIFMLLVLYGGFMWMLAAGVEEKVTKARQLIITSAVGLLVILAGYIITRVVVDQIITVVS